jgi:hypothetical protein
MEREVLELPETSKHETSPPAKTYLWLLRQRCRYWILNARSIEMANQLGPEAAATFDHKAKDKTHLNPKGRGCNGQAGGGRDSQKCAGTRQTARTISRLFALA